MANVEAFKLALQINCVIIAINTTIIFSRLTRLQILIAMKKNLSIDYIC